MASAPALNTIKPVEQGASSVVYAADGQRLGFITADTLRTPVGRNAIPNNVRNATVAIEDRRFYSHKGVDVACSGMGIGCDYGGFGYQELGDGDKEVVRHQ